MLNIYTADRLSVVCGAWGFFFSSSTMVALICACCSCDTNHVIYECDVCLETEKKNIISYTANCLFFLFSFWPAHIMINTEQEIA